jgi:hypothetical protein
VVRYDGYCGLDCVEFENDYGVRLYCGMTKSDNHDTYEATRDKHHMAQAQ